MHNNFLVDRGGKMSKSAGEFLVLETLVKRGIHPLAYRLMCLQAHYRSELEFTWDNVLAALTRLKRMALAMEKLREKAGFSDGMQVPALAEHLHPRLAQALADFDAAVSDDLNSCKALTIIDDLLAQKKVDAQQRIAVIAKMDMVMGLGLLELSREMLRIAPADASITPQEISDKLAERKAARADKDFARSDALRDELTIAGVEVMDGDPLGWEWAISA
jgi:cysteinyl-tRNA synthetase